MNVNDQYILKGTSTIRDIMNHYKDSNVFNKQFFASNNGLYQRALQERK